MKMTVKRLSGYIADRPNVKKYFNDFNWNLEIKGRVHQFYTVEKYYGKYISRHYAIRVEGKNKDKKHLLEFLRKSEDGVEVCRNLYYVRIYGHMIKFPHEKSHFSGARYDLEKFGKVWGSLNMYEGELITDIDALIANDDELKYCGYDKNVSFLKFIATYKKFPGLEILSKIGLTWLGGYKRLWKLDGDEKRKVIKYIFENAEELKENRWHFNFNEFMREVFPERKARYLKRKGEIAIKLQKEKEEARKNRIKFVKIINSALEKIDNKFTKSINFQTDYIYKLPSSIMEIKDFGNKLGHCYKDTHSYLKNHITGEALLVFIYDVNQIPIAAAEVTNSKIMQLRGKQNKEVSDSVLKEEVEYIIDIKKKLARKISKVKASIGDIDKAVRLAF